MKAAQQVKLRNALQGMLVLHSWNIRLIRSLLDELPKDEPKASSPRRGRTRQAKKSNS